MPPAVKPIDTWKSMSGLGTHYVRSITYGGELIASVRLISNNTRNKQDIKGALEGGAQLQGIDFGLEVEGAFMKDISKSVEDMQIKVHSSVPVSKIPHDIKELKLMLEMFPEDMKKYNKGRGVPLKIELWPLEYLDSTRPNFLKNKVLEAHLNSFEQKFDDLLNTKAGIHEWLKSTSGVLAEQQEIEIGKFYEEINSVLTYFYEVIGTLDMSKGTEQLQPALKAYGKGMPGHYYYRYLRMRENMMHDQGEWIRRRGSGATYTHWGRRNCTNDGETISAGYVVGPAGNGGGFNFLCLENRTKLESVEMSQSVPILEQAIYRMSTKQSQLMTCSMCRLTSKGSVRTFEGRLHCPADWNLLYRGIILSSTSKSMNTAFLCLDTDSSTDNITLEMSFKYYPLVPNSVSTISDSNEKKLFPCVVCSL